MFSAAMSTLRACTKGSRFLVNSGGANQRSPQAQLMYGVCKTLLKDALDCSTATLRARLKWLELPSQTTWGVKIQKTEINGVQCLLVQSRRAKQPERVLVYFHGGGYCIGTPGFYRPVYASLAKATGALVIGVDYRLAPEHPFPAAHDDCLSVVKQVLDTYKMPIMLAGDSAGGALAIDVARQLEKERGEQPIASLGLISPWVSPLDDAPEHFINDTLNPEIATRWATEYLGANHARGERTHFNTLDLGSLPPLSLQASEKEAFLETIRTFRLQLESSGCTFKYQECWGQFHAFQIFPQVIPEAKHALEQLSQDLIVLAALNR